MLNIQVDSRNKIMFIKKDIQYLSEVERVSFSETCKDLQKETGYKVLVINESTVLNIN